MIGIIGAMEDEVTFLRNRMDERQTVEIGGGLKNSVDIGTRDAMIFDVHEADTTADFGYLVCECAALDDMFRPRQSEINHRHIGESKLAGSGQHSVFSSGSRRLVTQTLRRISKAAKAHWWNAWDAESASAL